MVIGIIKNGNRIVGDCEIKEVTVSNNKFKTIVCNGFVALSRDYIIFICDKCQKEIITNKRIFCGPQKKYECICSKCQTIQTSLKKYGLRSPNQSGLIKEKQHIFSKKIDGSYVDGNAYEPRKTKTLEELYKLRSENAKKGWANGNYNNIDYSYLKKNWENPEIRERTLKHLRSPENRRKQSELAKARWLDPKYRSTVPNKISKAILSNPTEIERRRAFTRSLWDNDYEGQIKNLLNVSKQFSKLHMEIAEKLKLREKGFSGEQRVDRYLVDEINKSAKIIIEINGDYIHANPQKYQQDDIIKLPGNSYTAAEKWESDRIKIDKLQELGYKVIVIWESDNLEEVSKIIDAVLG